MPTRDAAPLFIDRAAARTEAEQNESRLFAYRLRSYSFTTKEPAL